MVHVQHSMVVEVTVEVAFDYLADYRTVPAWMFGVTRFEPTGPRTTGVDATFDAAMRIGPTTLTSVLQITDWEPNRLVALTAIQGFSVACRWELGPDDQRGCHLDADFSYHLPGGLAGKALGRLLDPFADRAISHTDAALRRHLEEQSEGDRSTSLYREGR